MIMTREHPKIVIESRPRSDLSLTLSLVGQLVSLGIVKAIQEIALRPGDPDFVHMLATVADVGRFKAPANLTAGGVATSRDAATAKAVGEAVERYCAEHYSPEDVIRGSFAELGSDAADPAQFAQFHDKQFGSADFPFVRLASTDVIGWTPAFSLSSGRSILVPALMAYIGHGLALNEPRWETTDVSGYACANTIEEAILGGLLEVIERDSFMLFWYHWMFVPALDLNTLTDPQARAVLERFGSAVSRVFVSNLTTDLGVPTVIATLLGGPGQPSAVISLGSDLTLEGAVRKALLELAANNQALRWFVEDRMRRGVPVVPTSVATQEDHGLLYTDPRMLTYLTPLLQPYSRTSCQAQTSFNSGDTKVSIEHCLRILHQFGHQVFVRDLTVPAIEDIGLKVVKVMAPGLRPIDFAAIRHLGGQRLYAAPLRMGFPTAAQEPAALNQIPHPFL